MIARRGYRVGVIDTDLQSPGVHVLFGFDEQKMNFALNHFLWEQCEIGQAAYEVTPSFSEPTSRPGQQPAIFLVPCSMKSNDIARVVREGYDIGRLNDGISDLAEQLKLDVVMIDTHPGINEETLLSIAMCDTLVLVLRPDQQDYLGTAVTVDVARRLEVQDMTLVVNKVPAGMDVQLLRQKVESAYETNVGAVLPHCHEMIHLGSADLFVQKYPSHELTGLFGALADRLLR
jgi:septum site-determining protein MinD